MPELMTAEEFVKKREAYSYPAVGLDGTIDDWAPVRFPSTWQMDRHHEELLISDQNARAVLGYLSTVFWGYFSGQDGRVREARAKSRVKLALDRIRDGGGEFGSAATKIRTASELIASDRCGDALEVLCELPQLGPAFASKVCAFLAPTRCGVIDSNIAGNHVQFGFSVDDKGNVKRTSGNVNRYHSYCSLLRETAEKLNGRGHEFRWRDRDNGLHGWRAVDVERAIFQVT